MLKKKRDQFHKQIRRAYHQKYMDQRRKQFQKSLIDQNEKDSQYIGEFFQHLKDMLHAVSQNKTSYRPNQIISEHESNYINLNQQPAYQKIQQYNYSQINQQNLSYQNKGFEYKNTKIAFVDIINAFTDFKAKSPPKYEQLFTKYMMDTNAVVKFCQILKDLVKNQVQSQEQDEDQPVEGVQYKYNSALRQYVTYQMLKFIDTLQYFAMGQVDSVFIIIDSLWQILTDDILFNQNDDYGILKSLLSVLAKLIQDPKNDEIYRFLKKKGIGNQIIKLIDKLRKIKIPIQVHQNLLKIIENYLSCQISIGPNQPDKIGGVTIQTYNLNQKQILLAYSIFFIDRKQQSLYPVVFSCLSKLFQLHQFLASTLKQQHLVVICGLMLHNNRQIQTQALNLINDVTCHSQQNLEYLLKNNYMFDLLNKRLNFQKSANDQFTNKNIERIAYIICNSLLTGNKVLKSSCLQHYIWQQIDSSFHPSHKLFPLIITMSYFFEANGHKNFDKYLVPYLQALQSFQWQMCKYQQQICDCLTRLFYNARSQWQQHQYELFLRIMNEYKFLYLVQEFIEKEDLQKLNRIQIQ